MNHLSPASLLVGGELGFEYWWSDHRVHILNHYTNPLKLSLIQVWTLLIGEF